MRLIATLLLAAAPLTAVAPPASAGETSTVRVAVLSFGTVNWLMNAIEHHELDAAEGYELELVELAGRQATTIAFQAGDVDLIVSDWLFALRQREAGRDVRYFPYSRALGRLMARPESGVAALCDLDGKTVGVVGGATDKSWLVYRALAARDCDGLDLASAADTVFGAPPLMSQQLQSGAVEAVSTYWHFAARLAAAGAETVISVDEAVSRLGIEPTPPLIGFIWSAERSDPEAVARFQRSVRAASAKLADDMGEWERLRARMNARNDAEFEALRDAYAANVVVDPWTEADTEAVRALHETMLEVGGEAYAEEAGPFDPAAFPDVDPD